MRFGGFCPFPLPLGGDITAAEHARLAADIAALVRSGRFAIVTYTKSGATVTIDGYLGLNGEGSSLGPSVTVNGTGDVTLTFANWIDPLDPAEARTIAPDIVSARGSVHGSTAGYACAARVTRNSVRVVTRATGGAATDGKATVIVNGFATANVGFYGSAPDKRDSDVEGDVPHAFGHYNSITSALGSSLSARPATAVHCRKLAVARALAGDTRLAERQGNNQLPGTSDEKLEYWSALQGVDIRPGASRHDLRARCAAKYRLALGPTAANEDLAIAELLGDAYVRTWRQKGTDLATPPAITYWAGGTAGPASYDLGGGAWLSERRNLVVETKIPTGMTRPEFLYLMNVQLFRLLDDMLPSTATFNWATGITGGGFLLDISQLDYTGMVH